MTSKSWSVFFEVKKKFLPFKQESTLVSKKHSKKLHIYRSKQEDLLVSNYDLNIKFSTIFEGTTTKFFINFSLAFRQNAFEKSVFGENVIMMFFCCKSNNDEQRTQMIVSWFYPRKMKMKPNKLYEIRYEINKLVKNEKIADIIYKKFKNMEREINSDLKNNYKKFMNQLTVFDYGL